MFVYVNSSSFFDYKHTCNNGEGQILSNLNSKGQILVASVQFKYTINVTPNMIFHFDISALNVVALLLLFKMCGMSYIFQLLYQTRRIFLVLCVFGDMHMQFHTSHAESCMNHIKSINQITASSSELIQLNYRFSVVIGTTCSTG